MIFIFLCLTYLVGLSRSIHDAASGISPFFFMAEWYSIVYLYHIFLNPILC